LLNLGCYFCHGGDSQFDDAGLDELTEEAKEDLYYYDAFEQKIIVSGIREQLSDQPDVETKNRRPMRDNKLAHGKCVLVNTGSFTN